MCKGRTGRNSGWSQLSKWVGAAAVVSAFGCEAGLMDPEPVPYQEPPATNPMMVGDAGTPAPPPGTMPAPTGPSAEEIFNSTVIPQTQSSCTPCHAPGGVAAYDFVDTPNDYVAAQSRTNFIDRANIEESRVLAKGVHDGPAWTPAQEQVIRNWLQAEVNNAPVETRFDPEPMRTGFVNYDLSPLGAPGSALHFSVEIYDAGLRFTNVTLVAGTEGLIVAAPTIEIYEGDALRQTVPISAVEETVDVNQQKLFDVLLAPQRYAETKIGVRFTRVSTLFGDGYGVVRCFEVEEFAEHAQPELNFTCVECHAQNPDAIIKMDLTELDQILNLGAQRQSCDRVLARIDRDDLDNSQLFRVVHPEQGEATGHRFQFETGAQYNSFVSQMLLWAGQEPRN